MPCGAKVTRAVAVAESAMQRRIGSGEASMIWWVLLRWIRLESVVVGEDCPSADDETSECINEMDRERKGKAVLIDC